MSGGNAVTFMALWSFASFAPITEQVGLEWCQQIGSMFKE